MPSVPSKLYSDDVSLVVVLLDTNPFFWGSATAASTLPFSKFLNQVIPFINSLLLLNQYNQVVLIATGTTSCGYIYDSGGGPAEAGNVPAVCSHIVRKLEEFLDKDCKKRTENSSAGSVTSLLSGSLSLALCCIL